MERQQIAGNLITFMPYMFRRFTKIFSSLDISKHQFVLLNHIVMEEGRPMSHYSEKLMIPKSNLTPMADKLIKEGFIEREFDSNDRRVVILKSSEKGREHLVECKAIIRAEMTKKLEVISDEEISRLNDILNEARAIIGKIEI